MRVIAFVKQTTLAGIVALALSNGTVAAQVSPGTISGRVIDKGTKQPIPGVHVTIVGTHMGASTDITGAYLITPVDEEVYKVKFSSLGYTSRVETEIRVVRGKTTMVKDVEIEEAPVETDSVVVTAGFFAADDASPLTAFTYSREEIRRSPGAAGDIFRAIETLPGVSSGGGEFSAFSVRGGSPKENIVLVDNIPFEKFSHLEGGTDAQEAQGGRFSVFTPGLIDEALFQAGGFSARYGGKNASFVDMKLKEGNRESPTANGSFDILGWEVNYDGPTFIEPNTSLLLSARHQNFSTILKMIGQKDMGQPSFTDLIAKTTTRLSPSQTLSFLVIHSPERFDRGLDNVLAAADGEYDEFIGQKDESKSLVGGNWRILTGKSSYLDNTVYYRKTKTEMHWGHALFSALPGSTFTPDNVGVRQNVLNGKDSDDQLGWKSSFSYAPVPALILETGLDISRSGLSINRWQEGLDTVYTFRPGDYRPDPSLQYLLVPASSVNATFSRHAVNAAAYAEGTYQVTDRLTLKPGVRFETSRLNEKHYLSPRFSLSYQLTDRVKLSAATGLYVQAPDFSVIAMNEANSSLADEKATHVILGLSAYASDDVRITVEGYAKELSHLIVRPDRVSGIFLNRGTGRASGVDVGIVKRFSGNWYGQINYSLSRSTRDDHDGQGEYDSDFSQPHMFNILVGCELSKELSVSAKWKYATGRPTDAFIVHQNVFGASGVMRFSQEITGHNADRMRASHSLNIRADYRKQLGRFALVTFVDVLNLYGRLNVNEVRFLPVTGGTVEKGFTVTPTIGVKLEM
jgi:outer membrane receptor protein involved in Fe transport